MENTEETRCFFFILSFFPSLLQTTVKTLRHETAEYMRQNPDDFLPFLTNKQGDMMTDEDFTNYCKDLETTAVWGGQPEVRETRGQEQLLDWVVLSSSFSPWEYEPILTLFFFRLTCIR